MSVVRAGKQGHINSVASKAGIQLERRDLPQKECDHAGEAQGRYAPLRAQGQLQARGAALWRASSQLLQTNAVHCVCF